MSVADAERVLARAEKQLARANAKVDAEIGAGCRRCLQRAQAQRDRALTKLGAARYHVEQAKSRAVEQRKAG